MIKPIAEAIDYMRQQERNYRDLAESLERIMPQFPDAIFDTAKVVAPSANVLAVRAYIEREPSGVVMAHPCLWTAHGDVVFGESIAIADHKLSGDADNGCWKVIMEHRGIGVSVIEAVENYLDCQKFPRPARETQALEGPAA